ncbi:MAG: TIM barrel protein [Planctomycetota bacterium]
MQITKEKIIKLKQKYKNYLKGNKVQEFLDEFGIRFSAGHWCAGDFCDRFASGGYNSDNPDLKSDIISQIERVSKAQIEGVELQSHLFINDDCSRNNIVVNDVKKALKDYSIVPTNMGITLFDKPKWKFGGVANVDKSVREAALKEAFLAVDIAKDIGCSSVSLWAGADGWDYNFEVNYNLLLERFIEGCLRINKKAIERKLKFGIEAKPYEPREGNMVVPTTHLAAFIANYVNAKCNSRNMGVVIDYGHEMMYGVEPGFTVYAVTKLGVPVYNIHINTAKFRSNDEDRVTGTGNNWQLAEFLYAVIDTGYKGWFSEDQFTYRLEPVKGMNLSKELFANIMKKAILIYGIKSKLAEAQATGDAGKTIDVVKEFLI